ncbi:hypothetical protein A2U01_0000268 [Trifolium medium]|uniref:Uncharacterized protein n=1 Tax=Trifolium medium TaxID=97028 RepID=A0A392LX65_9FABA|nr:hypothetical protein [Trifolium medium]
MFSYILANSLWRGGSKAWPLKQFTQKAELLGRALIFAKEVSSNFYELASTEAEILSTKHDSNFELMNQLQSSRIHGSIRGEMLCLWKLLDSHVLLNSSKYVWQENMFDVSVEGMIMKNQFSVETLFYCWTGWKDTIVHMVESLSNLNTQDLHQHNSYVKFALNYFGVQKRIYNLNDIYLLLIPDASWVMKLGDRSIKKNGKIVSVDVQPLVSYAQIYWRTILLHASLDHFHTLEKLYRFSVNKDFSEFCQVQSLLHVYEVSKFLLKSKCFSHCHIDLKALESYYRETIECLSRHAVPLDWKKSLAKEMVYQRVTESWQDIMKEFISANTKRKDPLTYGQIGRAVAMILGTANVKDDLLVQVMTRFEDNESWKDFIQSIQLYSGDESRSKAVLEMHPTFKLYLAMQYTFSVNWRHEVDFISPSCFMYLVERLLLLTSCWKGFMCATKSSFTEWLICQDENSLLNLNFISDELDIAHDFLANFLGEFVCDQHKSCIEKSKLDVKNYFPSLFLRLVVSTCLLHLGSGSDKYIKLLHNLLGKRNITAHLPLKFCNVLRKGKEHMGLEVFAEAFKVIGNPLVIAKLRNNSSEIVCSDAVFVDLTIYQKRELILEKLFPIRVDTAGEETTTEAFDAMSKEFSSLLINMPMDAIFWKWLQNLGSASANVSCCASMTIKGCLEAHIIVLNALIQNPAEMENKNDMEVLVSLFEDIMQLRDAMNRSCCGINEKDTLIALSKKILSRRSKVVRLLYQSNAWKESKYDMSNKSQGAVNSGHGKAKGKKNKGGKKGKK